MSDEVRKEQRASDGEKRVVRQMPNNLQAEQYILCCILIDGDAAGYIVPLINESYFYSPRHKSIYKAMSKLYHNGVVINAITVNDILVKSENSDIDSLDYLVDLTDITPSAINYKDYLAILHRDMIMRRLIQIANEIAEDAYVSQDAEKSISKAETKIYSINNVASGVGLEHIEKPSSRLLQRLEKMAVNPQYGKGLRTHFDKFDQITNGLQTGLHILAARPSVGKTAFVLNIIANMIRNGDKGVIAMFSLEMPAEQLMQRIFAINTDVGMSKMTDARLSESDQATLWSAHVEASNCQVYFDCTSMQTPGSIASKCRRLASMTPGKKIDLVVVDYLQLMANDRDKGKGGSANNTRQNDVSEISRAMKVLSMDLNCPVVALSQMSRSIEGRDDKQPRLSDLRESGAIEQDADMVMFLSRENEDDKIREVGNIILDIAKHRNGELAQIRYVWEGAHVRFTEAKDQQTYVFPKTAPKKKKPEDMP